MSTFSGLNSALTALHTHRRALDVSGQNVANANTEGYTRQRANLQSVGGNTIPAMWSTSSATNGGVRVQDVERMRDAFLEARGRSEHAEQAYLANQRAAYVSIENVFAEPSDTAIAAQLADFWGAWGDVANHPDDLGPRAALLQRGAVVADGLRTAHTSLAGQWGNNRAQLDAYATEINTTAASIANLNQTILRANNAGLPVNEMADQRDMHLMHLAELTGATSSVRSNGTVDVFIGGSTLVSGVNVRNVAAAGATVLADQGVDSARLVWAGTPGVEVTAGGTVGSTLDVLTKIIPGYSTELDTIAQTVATGVNDLHRTGFGKDGSTGLDFFVGTDAKTIRVALTEPDAIAAGRVNGTLDTANAEELAAFSKLPDGGDALYRRLVATIGVSGQSIDRQAEIQNAMTIDIDLARASDAGVNLDEEMTNMLASQRAYEAASRVLTTVDEMLDQLINRTGVVGR